MVEPHLRASNQHYPRTSLLCVENTHNRAGGTVTDVETMKGLRELCDRHGLALHVDGARLLTRVALGVPAYKLAEPADSVCICLSKGLSAPVGSVLAGSGHFVAQLRRAARKMLGGGMRQAGVIAAAGLVALREGIDRLAEDHEQARRLAKGLAEVEGLSVAAVQTNFVMVDTEGLGLTADQLVGRLKERDILASARPPYTVRFVTHRLIGETEVEQLIGAAA